MRKLVVLALVGFAAQLVDGALGMAYGVTSSTLLLVAGIAPASASASVHLAEIGTTLAAGVSHWRFGNVDWRVVARIGLPGAAGAFLGATLLSSISTEAAGPWMSGILFLLGVYLLIRFARPVARRAGARCAGGSWLRSAWSPGSWTPPAAGDGARWPHRRCWSPVGSSRGR